MAAGAADRDALAACVQDAARERRALLLQLDRRWRRVDARVDALAGATAVTTVAV